MNTFAATATFVSLRLLLTVPAKCKWPVYLFDFVAAYLHLPIEEDVWAPQGTDSAKRPFLKAEKGTIWDQKSSLLLVETPTIKNEGSRVCPLPIQEFLLYTTAQGTKGCSLGAHWWWRGHCSSEAILWRLEADLKDCLEIKWQEGVETIVGVGVTAQWRVFWTPPNSDGRSSPKNCQLSACILSLLSMKTSHRWYRLSMTFCTTLGLSVEPHN